MQIFQDIGDSVEVWDNLDLPAVQISNRISSYSQFVSSSYAEISIEENIVPTYINQMRAEALEQVLSGNLQRITHWGLNQDLEDNKTKAINTFSGELKAQVLKQSAEVDSHEWIKDPEKVADFFNGFNVQPIAPSVEKWLISTPNTGVGMAHELASTAQIIVATLGDADIDFEPEGGEGTDALNPKPILKPAKLNFELKDHLGNVRATFTPDNVNDSEVRSLSINSLTDYYPFGSQMPGRSFSSGEGDYRYGFNGNEKDDEVKGAGNSLDFGARIFDSRLGRFLSLDPLASSFAWQSPFVFANNNPINLIDFNGESGQKPKDQGAKSDPAISISPSSYLIKKSQAWNKAFNALQNHLQSETGSEIDRNVLLNSVQIDVYIDGEAGKTFVDKTIPNVGEQDAFFVISPKKMKKDGDSPLVDLLVDETKNKVRDKVIEKTLLEKRVVGKKVANALMKLNKGFDFVSTVLDPTELGVHQNEYEYNKTKNEINTGEAVNAFFKENNGSAMGVIYKDKE